jgi:hypothetical protein
MYARGRSPSTTTRDTEARLRVSQIAYHKGRGL